MPLFCLFLIAAISSYLLSGINPAICLSHLLHHEDIRTKGSKNPGFTNYKRVYGNEGWLVFILDISKAIILGVIFMFAFKAYENQYPDYNIVAIGESFVGLCAILGHAYPIYYKFKGGKGFLVSATIIFFIDYRVGLICFLIMLFLLLTTKIMSLSTNIAILSNPILLIIFHFKDIKSFYIAIILYALIALFMLYRHKENMVRLFHGEEKKFNLFKNK